MKIERMVLEQSHQFLSSDYHVVLAWHTDGRLHMAQPDFGDGDSTGDVIQIL